MRKRAYKYTLQVAGKYFIINHINREFGCQRITIQSGGTLNGLFLREKLLDYIDIVVAPVLIGGNTFPKRELFYYKMNVNQCV